MAVAPLLDSKTARHREDGMWGWELIASATAVAKHSTAYRDSYIAIS